MSAPNVSSSPFTEAELVALLREKADVYAQHPDYPWLLPEDEPNKIGNLMAYELRSSADLIEWRANWRAPSSRYLPAKDWIAENFALLLPGVALGAILGAVLMHWAIG